MKVNEKWKIACGIFLFSLFFIACTKSGFVSSDIIGRWVYEEASQTGFEFTEEGIVLVFSGTNQEEGTWSVADDSLILEINGEEATFVIEELTDQWLTISAEGEAITLVREGKDSLEQDIEIEGEASTEQSDTAEEAVGLEDFDVTRSGDGLFWVAWHDADHEYKWCRGIMDTDGMIFFELPEAYIEYTILGGFLGGYTYAQSTGEGFIIISEEGTIIYSSPTDSENICYEILAQGEENFLVSEKTTSMTENITRIGIMNPDGTWAVKPQAYWTEKEGISEDSVEYRYRGEGFYSMDYSGGGENMHLFLSQEGISFEVSQIAYISDFYNGEFICRYFEGDTSGHAGDIIKVTASGEIINLNIGDKTLVSANEGFIFVESEEGRMQIYDMNGNMIKDLSEYMIDYTPYFEDGYALLLIDGADGKPYLAVLDGNTMEFAFDPIQVKDVYYTDTDKIAWNNQAVAILYNNDNAVIDLTNGRVTQMPFDITSAGLAKIFEGLVTITNREYSESHIYNWKGEEIFGRLEQGEKIGSLQAVHEEYASRLDSSSSSESLSQGQNVDVSEYLKTYKELVTILNMSQTDKWPQLTNTSYYADGFYLNWENDLFSMKNEGAAYVQLYGIALGDSISDADASLKENGWIFQYENGNAHTYLAQFGELVYMINLETDADGTISFWYLNNWPEGDWEWNLGEDTSDDSEENRETGTSERDIFEHVLEDMLQKHEFPNNEDWEYDNRYSMSDNQFAVYDVDGDGKEELLIKYTTSSMAGMREVVYGADQAAGTVIQELSVFPGACFYENGTVEVPLSHNQGIGGDFWPYQVWEYDAQKEGYYQIGTAEAWSKEASKTDSNGKRFPTQLDIDGDGMLYYIMNGDEYNIDNPVDGDEYQEWRDSWLEHSNQIEIPYINLTQENIDKLF